MPDFPTTPLSDDAGRVLERATTPDYRLLAGETVADGVRRVALVRIDSALHHLHEAADDPATAVHETRKDLKKLRSLMRLVREPIGKKAYRRENRRFRDAARLLAGSRDAEVRLETLASLRASYGDEVPEASALVERLQNARDRAANSEAGIEQAATAIAAGTAPIGDLDLDEQAGFELLRAGIERSYRRGKTCLRAVARDPDPEAVHQWRKRVKDLWYHMSLVGEAWPAAMKAPEQEAHALADRLGDHHDLAVFIEALTDDEDDVTLRELAERRQGELLAEALSLGRRLYAEKPRRFAERLNAYWDAWQPEGSSARIPSSSRSS